MEGKNKTALFWIFVACSAFGVFIESLFVSLYSVPGILGMIIIVLMSSLWLGLDD